MLRVSGENIEWGIFPNNEIYLDWQWDKIDRMKITFHFIENNSLMELYFFVKEVVRRNPRVKIDLWITYMPYSRMDSPENNRVFTLKHVADMINSLMFDRVFIIEPHSDVTCALIDRSIKVPVTVPLFKMALGFRDFYFDTNEDIVVFPDAGAQKNFNSIPVKNRILNTVMPLHVPFGLNPNGKHVVIVDDLCSGGRTFHYIAEAIMKIYEPRAISLIVTHIETTAVDGPLYNNEYISNVVCTDSLDTVTHLGDVVVRSVPIEQFIENN